MIGLPIGATCMYSTRFVLPIHKFQVIATGLKDSYIDTLPNNISKTNSYIEIFRYFCNPDNHQDFFFLRFLRTILILCRINDVLEQFKHTKGRKLPRTASSKGGGITSSLNESKNVVIPSLIVIPLFQVCVSQQFPLRYR